MSVARLFVTDIDGNGCRQWRWSARAMGREGEGEGEGERTSVASPPQVDDDD